MARPLNLPLMIETSEAIVSTAAPSSGRVDARARIQRLEEARRIWLRLRPRERAGALFLATVRLQPALGPSTGRIIDLVTAFIQARR